MIILGIETSCDETAISVVEARGGFKRPKFMVLSHVVSSQVKLHAPYGGVYPTLAKREHIKNLPIVLKRALKQAKLNLPKIDAIAVTRGPGLEPALWTGITFAKDLAKKYKKPLLGINHMEGHIASVLLNGGSTKHEIRNTKGFRFPALALLVSGGHTELVVIRDFMKYKIIGETRDDAAGEAFDKVARLLGLPYPGGPHLSKLARKGVRDRYPLPRPMINSKNYDFSFSGLKTAVLYFLRDNPGVNKADIASSFEQAVIDVLVSKTIRAVKEYGVKSVILAGGVANNTELRKQLGVAVKEFSPLSTFYFPLSTYTSDNASMIAVAGYFHALKNKFIKSPSKLKAEGNLKLK